MKVSEFVHVLAIGAQAYAYKQVSRVGGKLSVLGALYAPFTAATDFCEELNNRFYFMGRDAQYTLDDCVAVLRGEPTQQPDTDWISENQFTVADETLGHATRWNGQAFNTHAEYHEATADYVDRRLKEIEHTLPDVRKLPAFQELKKQYPTLTDLEVETLRLAYDRCLASAQ